ncbi:MAG: DUF3015 family protein [Bdellovibrio sp.]|nr:DUF3015 family protein [Bdellovibrio sp.]
MKFAKFVVLALMVSSSAFAAPTKKGPGWKQEGYGASGCGLGSMVFAGDQGKVQQILAATTNGTSWNQAFGISSGTSNCEVDGALLHSKEVPAFIEVNKVALANDAARGQGETLAGLANLMKCDAAAMAPVVKKNYNKIFVDSQMQPAKIEANLNQVVTASKVCGA